MVAKELKLSPKALKLLTEYSEEKGITPSQAVEELVPKPKISSAKNIMNKAALLSETQADKLLKTPKTKAMPDGEAAKFARSAVRRYRAK
jgi:hypothetical protein